MAGAGSRLDSGHTLRSPMSMRSGLDPSVSGGGGPAVDAPANPRAAGDPRGTSPATGDAPFAFSGADVAAVVARAERLLHRNRALLDRLDAELGDGDHGENMSTGFADAVRAIRVEDPGAADARHEQVPEPAQQVADVRVRIVQLDRSDRVREPGAHVLAVVAVAQLRVQPVEQRPVPIQQAFRPRDDRGQAGAGERDGLGLGVGHAGIQAAADAHGPA